MKREIKTVLIYIIQPRTSIFLVALFNFVWFFSQSRPIQHFGSNIITFCCFCSWYWDWSLTNPASLSLIATFFMLFAQWKGYLAACLISGYQIVEGINWLSNASGFLGALPRRLQVISNSNSTNFWELLDIQYLLALIIFTISLIYFVANTFDTKQATATSYP